MGTVVEAMPLQAEVERLRVENERLRDENETMQAVLVGIKGMLRSALPESIQGPVLVERIQ